MDTLRSRQKRWLGQVLRHQNIDGQMQGEKVVEDWEQCSWIGWRRGRQYRIWTTKDVGTRQIKLASV